jgi:hypothetical protein
LPKVGWGRGGDTAPPAKLESILGGPETAAAWSRPERYFDAHVHVFNARDVPVREFISQCVAHSERTPLRQILKLIAPVAQRLAWTYAPSIEKELLDIEKRFGDSSSAPSALDVSSLDTEILFQKSRTGEVIFQELVKSNSQLLTEIAKSLKQDSTFKAMGGAPMNGVEAFIVESVQGTHNVPSMNLKILGENEMQRSMRAMFYFVGLMLSPRHHNLRTFIKSFHMHSPDLPLSGCFASMVDYKYWLRSPTWISPMLDQVRMHEKLAELSNGFLLPVVAYNPLVDYFEDGAALDLVVNAVKNHGCVGVKIYPPMGFKPYGNGKIRFIDKAGQWQELAGDKIDALLSQMYRKCVELGIPVMAHSNKSSGRSSADDGYAGPGGWDALSTSASTGVSNVVVQLAHFGGSSPHAGESQLKKKPSGMDDWTRQFAALMKRSHRLSIYGDIGYWNDLPTKPEVRNRLKDVLNTELGGGNFVWNRTLYGSDWHMLSNVTHWATYGNQIAKAIGDMGLPRQAFDAIFGGNVLECYGLRPGSNGNNWRRLTEHYSMERGRKLPGWVNGEAAFRTASAGT